MLKPRIIARLDVKGPNVVKGVCMEGLRIVGSPGNLASRYAQQGADEILYLDTVASLYGRNNLLPIVTKAADEIFVPLTVGGGVRSLEDMRSLLLAGADKIAVNTVAIQRPQFIREAADKFGSQCVTVSIEAKRMTNGWEALTDNGRERTGRDAVEWCREAESLGAGELLITSVDRDGTRKGFDAELIAEICRRVRIPVVASGGAGKPDDILAILKHATAVAIGSLLHFGLTTIESIKAFLTTNGTAVRC